LRSCVSGEVENLMFAGRNISATHIAFASTRVMATCAVIGQGVGTAAAHAASHEIPPARLAGEPEAVKAIQQRLLRDDAYLVGVVNEDAEDLALKAEVVASSERDDGPAANVVSGQSRAVDGPDGTPPGRAVQGTNRWMSDPDDGPPAWIELRWPEPVTVSEVQLVFDTGMHRVLTLSHSDVYTDRMMWGRPQPETVRDYTVEAMRGGKSVELADVTGGYQRLNRHQLSEAIEADAIRITVTATNGIDHARINEIRVY
jgi:hypothetical protein